jgi:hypothetical protein
MPTTITRIAQQRILQLAQAQQLRLARASVAPTPGCP